MHDIIMFCGYMILITMACVAAIGYGFFWTLGRELAEHYMLTHFPHWYEE